MLRHSRGCAVLDTSILEMSLSSNAEGRFLGCEFVVQGSHSMGSRTESSIVSFGAFGSLLQSVIVAGVRVVHCREVTLTLHWVICMTRIGRGLGFSLD